MTQDQPGTTPSWSQVEAGPPGSGARLRDALDKLWRHARTPAVVVVAGATPALRMAADASMAGVADLLRLAHGAQQTGALVVMSERGERALFLDRGVYVGAISTHEADRLGEVLWRRGSISLDQLLIATAMVRPGHRLGRTMVEQGYLAPADLYEALRSQALAVLEEACLQDGAALAFISGIALKSPLRLAEDVNAVLERAVGARAECRELERTLLTEDGPLASRVGAPTRTLSEQEIAMVQLVASARGGLTRADLLRRCGLGRLDGLRSLRKLLQTGAVHGAEAPRTEVKRREPEEADVRRRAAAVNSVLDTLEKQGFGADEPILELIRNPSGEFTEELAVLRLDGKRLDPAALHDASEMIDGGVGRMDAALRSLLDFAVFEARDALSEEALSELLEELFLLGVM